MMFEFLRKILCPFNKIEALVPENGDILDVGCGHGTFAEILAKKSKNRRVLGIDPSSSKISYAKKKERVSKNIKFKKGYLEDVKNQKFDCVTVIDVLYLLSPADMVKFLKNVKNLLRKKGVLILKTDSREPKMLTRLLEIEETIMVKLLKFTHSDTKKLYFLDRKEYRRVIKKAGLNIIKEKVFTSLFPYKHPTYVAVKNEK